MYYLYILKSIKNNHYYIGSTNNLPRRLTEHNNGKNASTKNRRPWKIVYTEVFDNLKKARGRELEIKRKKRATYINWLINNQNAVVV